jgi:hypothetical protein
MSSQEFLLVHAICTQLTATKIRFTFLEEEMAEII